MHCARTFATYPRFQSHFRQTHDPKRFKCPKCNDLFSYKRDLGLHIKRKHPEIADNVKELLDNVQIVELPMLNGRVQEGGLAVVPR